MSAESPPTHTPTAVLAAVLLRTARAALGITAAELASAAGCGEELVRRIESGELDPAIDTVGRIVHGVGLELRCGPRPEANPAYRKVDDAEVARVAAAVAKARGFREEYGLGMPGPPPGTQRDWDGQDPAPCRLFGVGPSRRDDGGWAALLVWSARCELRMSPAEFAAAAGISEADVARIETGERRPPLGEVQRILNAAGIDLGVRLEVYDDHDDVLHLRASADEARHERTIARARETFGAAVVLS